MAIRTHGRKKENLLLAALGCLALLGCGFHSSSPTKPQAESRDGGEGDGVTVVVDGDARDFSSATIRLCSEGLPRELMVIVTTTGPDCPEQFVQGPADSMRSRGKLCDELTLHVREFELGVAVAARGRSAPLAAYSRYEPPTRYLSTGDSGPGPTSGSITIREFRQLPGGEYRIGFAVCLTGEAEVSASGVTSVVPELCSAA